MSEQTVADFISRSDLIKKQVEDSVRLVNELRSELSEVRKTFEHLVIFAPDNQFLANAPYHLRKSDETKLAMDTMIKRQVERINLLLGDKR
jgi:hypothetical protein